MVQKIARTITLYQSDTTFLTLIHLLNRLLPPNKNDEQITPDK